MKKIYQIVFLLSLLNINVAQALLEIEINKGIESAIPIAIVPIKSGDAQHAALLESVVYSDLYRSGLFVMFDKKHHPQTQVSNTDINYDVWRNLGIEALVSMSFQDHDGEQLKLQVELYDLVRKRRAIGRSIVFEQHVLRRVAHKVSDVIFEQLTGTRGAFSTRIAYVSEMINAKQTKSYQLLVADSDGYNPQAIFTSNKQLMSPSWSPDGKQLTYVSFENDRAEIFLQNIVSGERNVISSQSGINSAPAWSPSGDYLALTLSFSGSPDIFIMDMRTRKLRQLTTHYGIDTEPAWTPDGRYLLFTSNRSGSPQIYKLPVLGGEPVRITFSGSYNAGASVSPDGESVAMVHNNGDGYRIALTDINGNQFRLVTDGVLDEAPSFAPNSSMIIYSTRHHKNIVLSAVSVDGKVKQRLSSQKGKVREPAWSPFR